MKNIILEVTGEMNTIAHDKRLPEDLHYWIEKLSTKLTDSLYLLRDNTSEETKNV